LGDTSALSFSKLKQGLAMGKVYGGLRLFFESSKAWMGHDLHVLDYFAADMKRMSGVGEVGKGWRRSLCASL